MKIKAKDVQTGDVMGFPVGKDIYAFARVLFNVEGFCCLAEIFDYKGTSLEFNEDILKAKRLVQIQNINVYAILSREWGGKVVYRDPHFKPDIDELRNYRIMNASQVIMYDMDWTPDCGRMRYIVERELWKEGLSKEEYEKLQESLPSENVIMNNYMVTEMIRKAWALKPYEWETGTKMYAWLEENGVYTRRAPRVRVAKGE